VSDTSKIVFAKVLTRALLRQVEQLKSARPGSDDSVDLKARVQEFEAELIRSALEATGGRLRQAARLLGTKATTLHRKIGRHKIALEVTDDEMD
jgi:DNA-binding NtrC family response regulator